MTTFTTTSPAGGDLPSAVTEIGGLVLDLVGTNGVRVVSQLAASQLYTGFFDSGTPANYQGNPGTIGVQAGLASALAALGGGIQSLAIRVTLFDGDTAQSNFDEDANFLLVNGVQVGNFSDVATQQTNADGTEAIAQFEGFADNTLVTGFFYLTDPAALQAIYDSILANGEAQFQLRDDVVAYDNYFDFKQGVDGGIVDVGTPPNVSPVAGDDAATTTEGQAVALDIGVNDSDPDGTIISYAYGQPSNGVVTGSGATLSYAPNAGFVGTDSFTYTVTDDDGATDTATVTITVTAGGTDGGGLPDCPTVTRSGTVDGSSSADQMLTGVSGANTFFFGIDAVSGDDTIMDLESVDIFVTDALLFDRNSDGIVGLGRNGVLDLDGLGSADTVRIGGASALRYLGESCEGVYVYADAATRLNGWIEGSVGDDALTGDTGGTTAQTFFWDTALKIDLGNDVLTNLGAGDRLAFTTELFDRDGDGVVGFGANNVLDFVGAGSSTSLGSIAISGTDGDQITALQFDGSSEVNGVTYYFYSLDT